jgi:hypothetical protein
MPDITFPTTFADGNTLTAAQINRNIYDPNATPDSLEVINGWLDNSNRQAGWSIERNHIRPRSMAAGRMVGLTGVLDYFDETFPVDTGEPDAHIPISGAGISFTLPITPTVLFLKWQVVIANDALANSGGTEQVELRLFIDGGPELGIFRPIPGAVYAAGPPALRDVNRDRIWSGHWMRATATDTSQLVAGEHTAYIGVWSQANTTRVRIRNFKHWWIR